MAIYSKQTIGLDGRYHTIYIVKNMLNDNYYKGKHSTSKPTHSYKGSGNSIKAAHKEFGRCNFHCHILGWFDTEFEAYEAEAWFITQEDVDSPNCYNEMLGGMGNVCGASPSEETKVKMSKSASGKVRSESHRKNLSIALTGKSLSEETKLKVSTTLNSKYRISDGIVEKLHPKSEPIPDGWYIGNSKLHDERLRIARSKFKGRSVSEQQKKQTSETIKRKLKSDELYWPIDSSTGRFMRQQIC